ncbi:hypothetical protein EV127DRAFT_414385 [Xylaria flabelliformis]|nr:hypothetical protein EV127DRAFT_414385 [Xylaria flabelliformis]
MTQTSIERVGTMAKIPWIAYQYVFRVGESLCTTSLPCLVGSKCVMLGQELNSNDIMVHLGEIPVSRAGWLATSDDNKEARYIPQVPSIFWAHVGMCVCIILRRKVLDCSSARRYNTNARSAMNVGPNGRITTRPSYKRPATSSYSPNLLSTIHLGRYCFQFHKHGYLGTHILLHQVWYCRPGRSVLGSLSTQNPKSKDFPSLSWSSSASHAIDVQSMM